MEEQDYIERQRLRYDKEAKEHFEHYQDEWTQAYRDQFYRVLFHQKDLQELRVLDAMCASGIETGYLLARGAEVVGLDISPENAVLFRSKWERDCAVASIHNTKFPDESFNVVYIMGGLHHIKPLLAETVDEVARILKPGGWFFFVEPNKATWVNYVRDFWYKMSDRFANDEEALDYHEELKPLLGSQFVEDGLVFGGNIAYLIIGQSMVLKVPEKLKALLARPLFRIERLLTQSGLAPKLFFAGIWRKQI